MITELKNTTLHDYFLKYPTMKAYERHSIIRGFAKSWNKNFTRKCLICGYDKHTELCHIKPVSLFDADAKLGDINDPKNLIPLCPNCHWEFDNNLIPLETILTIKNRGGGV